jgi:hypothetical protein
MLRASYFSLAACLIISTLSLGVQQPTAKDKSSLPRVDDPTQKETYPLLLLMENDQKGILFKEMVERARFLKPVSKYHIDLFDHIRQFDGIQWEMRRGRHQPQA